MRKSSLVFMAAALALSGAAAPAAAGGLGSLYSCNAQGSADTTGAVVGGLVGALAGSQVAGKHDRALGAVIGAGLGAAIGNGIGCRMDRKAQQDARQAFQTALDTGRAQSWSDPQSGTTGRIEVLGPAGSGGSRYGGSSRYYGSQPSQSSYGGRWRYASGVAVVQRVNSQGGTYEATSRVNMRAAPSQGGAIVDRLQPGEQVEIAGSVPGGWLAVIENGYVQGYVSSTVVRPVGRGSYGGGGDDCRLVESTTTERGAAPMRERFNACRDNRGEWNLTAA